MTTTPFKGLSDEEVAEARRQHGANQWTAKEQNGFWRALREIVLEPMFLLLLAAAVIYFVSGDWGDGLFMAVAIVLVTAISLYQDTRTRKALDALKALTEPRCRLIRNGVLTELPSEEMVPDDLMVLEEGELIPADGLILQANDFSVNEAVLTGESFPVSKNERSEDARVFQGTITTGGRAICRVTAIGNQTELGKIGRSLADIQVEQTPLQRQISGFVQKMAIIGMIVFLMVWVMNYALSGQILDSLLKSLTLAMSILPEEIPVAFTTFMALGAWRLMKMGIIVKHAYTVEALGSATVICTDKTGTITENRMELARLYCLATHRLLDPANETLQDAERTLIDAAMWASEPTPFDPMEKALHKAYDTHMIRDERPHHHLVHEYPLDGQPPMMTHIFEHRESGSSIIAAKGAPEALLAVSDLTEAQRETLRNQFQDLAREGYRVLGVGVCKEAPSPFPQRQQALSFQFLGLVAFYDPPKANIAEVFQTFYRAGVQVKIVTGDTAATTLSIARQTGLTGADKTINGAELMELSDEALQKTVLETQIFTRMFPEAKLRIINALKNAGEIVAMTGDGVNDGPALKAAHIGVAMGKKGTEIAKQASALVLADDDLARMADAIAMGRKIYTNLKKAIQYIISIHIPILLTVFIPLALGWKYPNIFTPVHVIFLEMIMGPTCSIVYENEPMDSEAMRKPPRPFSNTFFQWSELVVSIVQGLVITAGVLSVYILAVRAGWGADAVRTLVFVSLIMANIALTLVNRSFYDSIWTSLRYKNPLLPAILGVTLLLTALLLFVPPFARFFELGVVSLSWLGIAAGIGMASAFWFELVKWRHRRQSV